MIERQFVNQKIKEFQVQEYIKSQLTGTGFSHIEIQRTPLGEKVIVFTARPGLVVGRKGENIKKLTNVLKKRFSMENPQIEIGELSNPMLDANFVADKITTTLVRFGSKRFKSIGYKTLQNIIDNGALGAEIVISGKVPSARARSWRFKAGHLKKSGDISANKIKRAISTANLKSGTVGVKVSIMTPDIILPDKVFILDKKLDLVEKPKEENPTIGTVTENLIEKIVEEKPKEVKKTRSKRKEKLVENEINVNEKKLEETQTEKKVEIEEKPNEGKKSEKPKLENENK